MTPRIYADFNSGGWEGQPCWCLRYGDGERRSLDEFEDELQLTDGMIVVLFYEDPGEEFEVMGTLERSSDSGPRWLGRPDWNTLRYIRE